MRDNNRSDGVQETDSGVGPVDRRRFMQATGAIGAAGLTGASGLAGARNEYGTHWEDPNEVLQVLYLGGVEDEAEHYSEELYKVIGPYLLHQGVEVVYTERQDDLNPDTLSNYDAVMLYGNRLEPTEEQIDALEEYVENGGGFVPVHSASASFGAMDEEPDELGERFTNLVGGGFAHHGHEDMTTDRIEPDHPVLEDVEEIEAFEETYRHHNFADDIEVLAYADGGDYEEDEEEPFTWVREQGDGRVFYTAWGHDENAWEEDGFQQLLHNAVRWTSGNEDTIGDHPTLDDLPYAHVEEYSHPEIPYEEYGQGPAPEEVQAEDDEDVWAYVQDPLEVSESLSHTVTPAEFEIEHFVSEETLPEEIEGQILDMTFDAAGRCWISITQDYPNEQGAGEDKIVLCEDTDDDGQADEFTVFKEDLSVPLSIIAYRDGVIVSEVEDDHDEGRIVYFGDTDGDGVADEEEVIVTGFGTSDTHAGVNQLRYGIDNWIWGVVGYEGFTPDIDEDLELSQDLFRFKPDGSEIEFVGSLPSNTAGITFNEEGLPFASAATAGSHITAYAAIPNRYFDHVDGYDGPTDIADIMGENLSRTEMDHRILPINDRYRQVDQQDGYTAAADHQLYTAREYPEQYWNSTAFVGEGTGQLLGTFYLEQDGAGYTSVNHNNLVTSNDEWASPTYANVGPDGQVWMIDFYNFIFQHNPTPEDYETGDGNAYETDVRDQSHGRLYRVTYGDDVEMQPQDLTDADSAELVDALTDDNMFWRMTAQRMLVEREDTDVVDDLTALVDEEDEDELGLDPGAVHALWTLDAIDEEEATEAAYGSLDHSVSAVRLNALRILSGEDDLQEEILDRDLLDDEDGRVQQWALLALAETEESDEAGQAVYDTISQEEATDDLLIEAATAAGARHADGFIDAYESEHEPEEDDDDEDEVGDNVLANPDFEEGEDSPDEWEEYDWSGEAEFTYDDEEAYSGDHSVRIDSEEGADAAWHQTVDVEEETEYILSGWIMTDEFDEGSGYGAQLNVHELGEESLTESVTETEDWTEVTTTINSGSNDTFQINCLFGGWGESTGTAWFDDILLAPVGDTAEGLDLVYERVSDHAEADEDDEADDEDEALDPDDTIEFDGSQDEGWVGTAPEAIEGEENPTLTLADGEEYSVEWTNVDGQIHWFAIWDDQGDTLAESEDSSEEGETIEFEFTAGSNMVEYVCPPHLDSMIGDIEIVDDD
ncbi:PVC-type heme-binding CxxCH protein [Natrialbaceae archaeon A-arb3/5]